MNTKNMSLEEKIKVLKAQHQRSHPDAKEQIASWERDLERLTFDEKWLKHPNTEELRLTLDSQLERINYELQNDEALEDAARKVHFKNKNTIMALLALLTVDVESRKKEIDRQITANL